MTIRLFLLVLSFGYSFASDTSADYPKSKYWTTFSAPTSPSNIAQFSVDERNLAITSAGEARSALEHCLLLGCEVVKVNGIAFYLPTSLKDDEPLKAPISSMTIVQRAEELDALLKQNRGKVCFIWTGKQAEFSDVLSMATLLTSQGIPFYFGIRDELANSIKVTFF